MGRPARLKPKNTNRVIRFTAAERQLFKKHEHWHKSTRLYVKLQPETTEEMLHQNISNIVDGLKEAVVIRGTPGEPHRSRGYGFLQFRNAENARKLVDYARSENLSVWYASEPRKNREFAPPPAAATNTPLRFPMPSPVPFYSIPFHHPLLNQGFICHRPGFPTIIQFT